jgi:hypothetical protein
MLVHCIRQKEDSKKLNYELKRCVSIIEKQEQTIFELRYLIERHLHSVFLFGEKHDAEILTKYMTESKNDVDFSHPSNFKKNTDIFELYTSQAQVESVNQLGNINLEVENKSLKKNQ